MKKIYMEFEVWKNNKWCQNHINNLNLCSCIDQQSQIDYIGFSHWDSSYSY